LELAGRGAAAASWNPDIVVESLVAVQT